MLASSVLISAIRMHQTLDGEKKQEEKNEVEGEEDRRK
jgi:hypothetical protein